MKFISNNVAYIALAGYAFAEENSDDGFPGVRGLKTVKNMLADLSCANGNCVDQKEYQKTLRGYGCNCFSNDANADWEGMAVWHFTSRGEPIDELDTACKEAFKRYKCLEQDFSSGSLSDESTCMPGMLFDYHMNASGEIVCGPEDNPEYANDAANHSCKLAACEIERAFSMRAFAAIGNEMNNSGKKLLFQDSNKKNFDVSCVARPGPPRDACCGSYPERKPYSSDLQSCCDNGNVRSFGSC
jgi:hypothetical protein